MIIESEKFKNIFAIEKDGKYSVQIKMEDDFIIRLATASLVGIILEILGRSRSLTDVKELIS